MRLSQGTDVTMGDSTSEGTAAEAFLNCSRCRLSIRVRARTVPMEHCPRCLARARILQPLFVSSLPVAALCGEDSGPRQPSPANDRR